MENENTTLVTFYQQDGFEGELLGCPFCACQPKIQYDKEEDGAGVDGEGVSVACQTKGCEGYQSDFYLKGAVEKWNTRSGLRLHSGGETPSYVTQIPRLQIESMFCRLFDFYKKIATITGHEERLGFHFETIRTKLGELAEQVSELTPYENAATVFEGHLCSLSESLLGYREGNYEDIAAEIESLKTEAKAHRQNQNVAQLYQAIKDLAELAEDCERGD